MTPVERDYTAVKLIINLVLIRLSEYCSHASKHTGAGEHIVMTTFRTFGSVATTDDTEVTSQPLSLDITEVLSAWRQRTDIILKIKGLLHQFYSKRVFTCLGEFY